MSLLFKKEKKKSVNQKKNEEFITEYFQCLIKFRKFHTIFSTNTKQEKKIQKALLLYITFKLLKVKQK
jgi:hypothetical protein